MLPLISPSKAKEMVESGRARLVDIRESSEYAQEHVPGSRLVPLSVASSYAVKDADAPEKPVVYFCNSGRRTQNNAELLEKLASTRASPQNPVMPANISPAPTKAVSQNMGCQK